MGREPRERVEAGRTFPRQWYRTVVPAVFVTGVCGLLALRAPAAAGAAVLMAVFGVPLCLLLHGGLVVTADGIAWYVLRPRWRYRAVPWDAVLDVRRTLGVLEPIRLDVRHGRYEAWVWGEPQPNRVLNLEVWSNGYAGGEDLRETIRAGRAAHAVASSAAGRTSPPPPRDRASPT